MARAQCNERIRAEDMNIIAKAFDNLPSDTTIARLEKYYFKLNSLATCLYLLKTNLTSKAETEAIYRRVVDIAFRYVQADLCILLTEAYLNCEVAAIFNQYAAPFKVRYIYLGEPYTTGNIAAAKLYFNETIDAHLAKIHGSGWRNLFHAQLEQHYNNRFNSLSRREKRRIRKDDCE
jgi:hypothetical protein